jgi:acetyltransferase-like isoleucine patch superfamily enzyme
MAQRVPEVLGVNDRLQLAQLEAHPFARGAERALMRSGATLADPARVDVRGTLKVGRDVQIDVNVLFEGVVTLGDRVRIGPNCVIRDVTDRRRILSCRLSCVLEQATVGANCRSVRSRDCVPARRCRGRAHRQFRRSEEFADGQGRRRTTSPTWATPRSARASTSAPAPSSATTTA